MSVEIRPFQPTAESLERLWKKFDENRSLFPALPANPFEFVCWLAAEDTKVFEVGGVESPAGVFIFTGIIPGESAWAHIYLWDLETTTPVERVQAAQVACAVMFRDAKLRRISGLTPVTNAPALVFAERVGFKREGRIRKAVVLNDLPTDAWLTGLLPEDLAGSDTMEKKETA
jgi:hypothetical protein